MHGAQNIACKIQKLRRNREMIYNSTSSAKDAGLLVPETCGQTTLKRI
jgi:hypothetical protein